MMPGSDAFYLRLWEILFPLEDRLWAISASACLFGDKLLEGPCQYKCVESRDDVSTQTAKQLVASAPSKCCIDNL